MYENLILVGKIMLIAATIILFSFFTGCASAPEVRVVTVEKKVFVSLPTEVTEDCVRPDRPISKEDAKAMSIDQHFIYLVNRNNTLLTEYKKCSNKLSTIRELQDEQRALIEKKP